MKPGAVKLLTACLLTLLTCGCATTYVPISWGFGEKVHRLSRSDLTLTALFDRYDPQRKTLRVGGASFDEVMMPSEVKHHLGAYRTDTRLIYRSLYHDYSEHQLRDLMAHELAHHIWFTGISHEQRDQWRAHLRLNPSPLQDMVRRVYSRSADFDAEDFAFTVEYPRPIDIEELARLKIIGVRERDAILREQCPAAVDGTRRGSPGLPTADSQPAVTARTSTDKGTGTGK